jgi:RNA polymerase sigma-70 factor (ECF subfamily)
MKSRINSNAGSLYLHDSNCLFAEIYKNHFDKIQKNIFKLVKDWEVTNDLTSEVLLKAMLNIHSFQDRGNTFGAWLNTIARNEVFQYFRDTKKEQLLKSMLSTSAIIESNIVESLNDEKLFSCLKSLNEKELQIIEWRYFDALSFKEISNRLNISENNAKVRCFRTIEKLRKKFNSL